MLVSGINCEARGWIAVEYIDRGVSGAKDRRPALDSLLQDAKRRRFDVLVCWHLDRRGRNLRHLVTMLEDLNHVGHSDKPHAPVYGREMTLDILRLLDSLGVAKAHIVGYSMGAELVARLSRSSGTVPECGIGRGVRAGGNGQTRTSSWPTRRRVKSSNECCDLC